MQDNPTLHTHKREAYLVGGSIRNILLGEECIDWDIVADRLDRHYVYLHDKFRQVALKDERQETIFLKTRPCDELRGCRIVEFAGCA